jgi:hypothetical protein
MIAIGFVLLVISGLMLKGTDIYPRWPDWIGITGLVVFFLGLGFAVSGISLLMWAFLP